MNENLLLTIKIQSFGLAIQNVIRVYMSYHKVLDISIY